MFARKLKGNDNLMASCYWCTKKSSKHFLVIHFHARVYDTCRNVVYIVFHWQINVLLLTLSSYFLISESNRLGYSLWLMWWSLVKWDGIDKNIPQDLVSYFMSFIVITLYLCIYILLKIICGLELGTVNKN